ncbi:hypothetical protein N7535_000530 [Penicillium sp. DV-2018c]|nr:hypothetical protein N7461_006222 [Penicillium sp. DV-2018c]KAJ5581910.1 hypothetical protein N7535_000530 [Penicillium sp. DV-2018c]
MVKWEPAGQKLAIVCLGFIPGLLEVNEALVDVSFSVGCIQPAGSQEWSCTLQAGIVSPKGILTSLASAQLLKDQDGAVNNIEP